MQDSQLNSVNVPQVGAQDPGTLFIAADKPIRVVVFNNGPILVLIAHDPPTLSNAPAFSNTWRLPPNKELVIVLAPKQGLYAAGIGVGGTVSIAASEALPVP